MWCIEDQLAIAEQLMKSFEQALASDLKLSSILILRELADRAMKIVLLEIGTLRCSDVGKAIEDAEDLVLRIVRKSVRNLAKNIKSMDIDEVAKALNIDRALLEELEHLVHVSSSRAKAHVQKALSEIYERLSTRFNTVRSSFYSDIAKLLFDESTVSEYLRSLRSILSEGLLREPEVEHTVMIVSDVLESELNRLASRISREFRLPIEEVKKVLFRRGELKTSVRQTLEKASQLLKSFAIFALVHELTSVLVKQYINTPTPSQRALNLLNSALVAKLSEIFEVFKQAYSSAKQAVRISSSERSAL